MEDEIEKKNQFVILIQMKKIAVKKPGTKSYGKKT